MHFLTIKIKQADIHCDKKSYEEYTENIKKKYKIYYGHVVGSLVFFILTSHKDSCARQSRICIEQKDLLNKKQGHLNEPRGYLDTAKPDILSEETVEEKINDPKNRFECIANLSIPKYRALKNKLEKLRSWKYPAARNATIQKAKNAASDEFLAKFGL